ncbi:hypothetical protein POPTR_008G109150v4, partial [Populus trichocarpa]
TGDSGDDFPGFQTCVHKEEMEYRGALSRLQRRAPCPLQIKPHNNAFLASSASTPTSSFNPFCHSKINPISLLSPLVLP